MGAEVANYQCPACTAPLRYSGETDLLVCDYCGSSYTPEEVEALHREAEEVPQEPVTFEHTEPEEWDADSFTCPSCGAELICEDTTAATACPYCGNPSIVPGRLHGVLKPDCVLPFRVDKNAAIAALKKHYSGKFLLPKVFRSENHLQEVKGIYVPFWLFDGEADGDFVLHGTRTHVHQQGDYEVTETHHFRIHRKGTVSFRDIPTDASQKMPDDYMDSLEPFDLSELKPFSTGYLPGFLADRYDVSAEECTPRVETRCRESARQKLCSDVIGYTSVIPIREDVSIKKGQVRYALLPVWLLYTQWKGKRFLFAVNGQTGRIVGDLPTDTRKAWLLFLAVTLGLTAVLTLLGAAGPLGAFLYGLFR